MKKSTLTVRQAEEKIGEAEAVVAGETGSDLANLPATAFEAEKLRREEAKRAEKVSMHMQTKRKGLKIERKANWSKWIVVLADAHEKCFYVLL